ncbi:MAG TPA: hypothetical protein VLR49_03685, partial [Ferruginibacter sp.]|nr:hypothetical protein [Ferruginibacter sp.]
MKIILLSTLISILIISCKNEKKEYLNVIITGNVKGIPATKIYLTDAYNAKNILDSSDYINDKFSFNYVPNKDSRSLLVSLRFFNKNNNMRNTILVRNKFSAKNGSSAFILEKGTTIISGENFGIENNGTTILDIFSGKQNDVFFKLQNKGFGFVTKSDSGTRYKEISYFKSIINKYPYSYYLLQEIVSNKETYTKAELSDIIKLFSTEIQNS